MGHHPGIVGHFLLGHHAGIYTNTPFTELAHWKGEKSMDEFKKNSSYLNRLVLNLSLTVMETITETVTE